MNTITVGEQSSIGDKAVVHAAKMRNDLPTKIGSRVTVGKSSLRLVMRHRLDHTLTCMTFACMLSSQAQEQ